MLLRPFAEPPLQLEIVGNASFFTKVVVGYSLVAKTLEDGPFSALSEPIFVIKNVLKLVCILQYYFFSRYTKLNIETFVAELQNMHSSQECSYHLEFVFL